MRLYGSSATLETSQLQDRGGKSPFRDGRSLFVEPDAARLQKQDAEPAWTRFLVRGLRLILGIYLLPVLLVIAGTTLAIDLVWRCSRLIDVVFREVTAGIPGWGSIAAKPAQSGPGQKPEAAGSFHLRN